MTQRPGPSIDAVEAARSVLAARDIDIADADRQLAELLGGAHLIALQAIRRLDEIGADIEAAVHSSSVHAPAGARELTRYLIDKQRSMIEVISQARADVESRIVVLQRLTDRYRPT